MVVIFIGIVFLGLILGSVTVKFSGFLVKKSKISWKHSFLFCALLFATMLIFGFVRGIFQLVLPQLEMPAVLQFAIRLCLDMYVASEYLGSRALDQEGNAIGATRSALIGALLFIMATALTIILRGVSPALV